MPQPLTRYARCAVLPRPLPLPLLRDLPPFRMPAPSPFVLLRVATRTSPARTSSTLIAPFAISAIRFHPHGPLPRLTRRLVRLGGAFGACYAQSCKIVVVNGNTSACLIRWKNSLRARQADWIRALVQESKAHAATPFAHDVRALNAGTWPYEAVDEIRRIRRVGSRWCTYVRLGIVGFLTINLGPRCVDPFAILLDLPYAINEVRMCRSTVLLVTARASRVGRPHESAIPATQ